MGDRSTVPESPPHGDAGFLLWQKALAAELAVRFPERHGLVPLARAQGLLRGIPHARLQALDGCGHLPMLEQPGAFNRVVAEFLRTALAAPRPLAEVV